MQPFGPDAAEATEAEAADGGDFGGESYTSRPRSKSLGGSGTMSTSGTRQALGRVAAPPYHHQEQQSVPRSPLSESVPSSAMSPTTPNGDLVAERERVLAHIAPARCV